jgi:Response regulators consisting of a CheY-like receiver domain and a winged-helix DNA-binding domain
LAYKILVVDDEKLIVKGIKFSLEQDNMSVDTAFDGEEAINMIKQNNYDLLVLDLMLPKLDGLEVCQMCREFSDIPIIMLTAKGEDMDKIIGLEYGADDYLTKPFNILELKARIKAILRRSKNIHSQTLDNNNKNRLKLREIEIDTESKRVFVNNKEKKLTSKEFILLEILMNNPEKIYSRENLLKMVWGNNYPGDERTVDVHVRRLREKIEANPGAPEYIQTKWGIGYYFKK